MSNPIESGFTKQILPITDKNGVPFNVNYYKFAPNTETNAWNVDELAAQKASFESMAHAAFPNYTETGFTALMNKINAAKAFDLVTTSDGEVIAFHVFRIANVYAGKANPNSVIERNKSDRDPIKTIYVDHAATHPDFENRGLTTTARLAVFDEEKPEVFCGSSANGGIYVANQRIAEAMNFRFHPTASEARGGIGGIGVAPWAQFFAERIHDQMGLNNADLDASRLVRTYKSPVSQGKKPHPLAEILDLGPTQHVFYMGISETATHTLSWYKGYPPHMISEKPWRW